MTIPVAPQEMSPTDPKRIGGVWSFIARFNDLIAWIKSLSPSGATVYDTGWVDVTLTAGITTPASQQRLQVRRVAKTLYARGRVEGSITAGTPIATLPPGFTLTGTTEIAMTRNSISATHAALVRGEVTPSGNITPWYGTAVAAPSWLGIPPILGVLD